MVQFRYSEDKKVLLMRDLCRMEIDEHCTALKCGSDLNVSPKCSQNVAKTLYLNAGYTIWATIGPGYS